MIGEHYRHEGRVWTVTAQRGSDVELRSGSDYMVRSAYWVRRWMEGVT